MNYDVVIIGSGPAGISTAEKLISSNLKVLIIDSGNDVEIKNYESESWSSKGNFAINFEEERKKAFFGTTALWKARGIGGHLWEFDKCDFIENFNNKPYNKWNIDFAEITTAYQDAKHFFEMDNDAYSDKFKKTNKLGDQWSSLLKQYDMKIASTFYSQKNYYEQFILKKKKHLLNSNNIDLLFDTSLHKLLLNKDKRKVDKVILMDKNSQLFEVFCKDVIIAAGCFENNSILFKFQKQYSIDIKNLGKYITFHPSLCIGKIILDKGQYLNKNEILKFSKVFLLKDKFINKKLNLNFGINIVPVVKVKNIRKSTLNNINDIKDTLINKNFFKLAKMLLNFIIYGDFIHYSVNKISNLFLRTNEIEVNMTFEHLADKENCIKFSKNDEVFSVSSSLSKKNLLMLSEVVKITQDKIFKIFSRFKPLINKYDQIVFETNNHHHGGTIIDTLNISGVVDTNLKLKNFDNIYICGSSTFPSSSIYNPTLTIIAMGLRLSKFILMKSR